MKVQEPNQLGALSQGIDPISQGCDCSGLGPAGKDTQKVCGREALFLGNNILPAESREAGETRAWEAAGGDPESTRQHPSDLQADFLLKPVLGPRQEHL